MSRTGRDNPWASCGVCYDCQSYFPPLFFACTSPQTVMINLTVLLRNSNLLGLCRNEIHCLERMAHFFYIHKNKKIFIGLTWQKKRDFKKKRNNNDKLRACLFITPLPIYKVNWYTHYFVYLFMSTCLYIGNKRVCINRCALCWSFLFLFNISCFHSLWESQSNNYSVKRPIIDHLTCHLCVCFSGTGSLFSLVPATRWQSLMSS